MNGHNINGDNVTDYNNIKKYVKGCRDKDKLLLYLSIQLANGRLLNLKQVYVLLAESSNVPYAPTPLSPVTLSTPQTRILKSKKSIIIPETFNRIRNPTIAFMKKRFIGYVNRNLSQLDFTVLRHATIFDNYSKLDNRFIFDASIKFMPTTVYVEYFVDIFYRFNPENKSQKELLGSFKTTLQNRITGTHFRKVQAEVQADCGLDKTDSSSLLYNFRHQHTPDFLNIITRDIIQYLSHHICIADIHHAFSEKSNYLKLSAGNNALISSWYYEFKDDIDATIAGQESKTLDAERQDWSNITPRSANPLSRYPNGSSMNTSDAGRGVS